MKEPKNIPTDRATVAAQVLEFARLPLGPSPAQTVIEMVRSFEREHGAMLAPTVGLPAIFAELQRQAKDARFDFLKVNTGLADIVKGVRPGLEGVVRLVQQSARAQAEAVVGGGIRADVARQMVNTIMRAREIRLDTESVN